MLERAHTHAHTAHMRKQNRKREKALTTNHHHHHLHHRQLVCFRGHRAAVTTLKFLNDGLLLASGSNDTDFIVWDIEAEAGLVRLHGHTGPITDIAELPRHGLLLTSSRDHHIRVWDPEAQHCVQVRVLHYCSVTLLCALQCHARRVFTCWLGARLRMVVAVSS